MIVKTKNGTTLDLDNLDSLTEFVRDSLKVVAVYVDRMHDNTPFLALMVEPLEGMEVSGNYNDSDNRKFSIMLDVEENELV